MIEQLALHLRALISILGSSQYRTPADQDRIEAARRDLAVIEAVLAQLQPRADR